MECRLPARRRVRDSLSRRTEGIGPSRLDLRIFSWRHRSHLGEEQSEPRGFLTE
jgi:hypothetical protein